MDVQRHDILKAKDDVIEGLTTGESLRLSVESERELAMRDTYYLCKYVLGYNKLNETFHLKFAQFYDRWLYHLQFHLHPRGHYKTTISTVAGSIRLSLLDPDITILIVTNKEDNARKFVGEEIRQHFIANEKFRDLFPEHAVHQSKEEGTSTKFVTPARTKSWIRSPTFEGASVDQRLTSNHYIHVKYDDIVDDKNTASGELRDKNRSDYVKILSLCDGRTPDGYPWHHLCGTRWHLDDTYHHILEEDRERKTKQFKTMITSSIYKDKNGKDKFLFQEEFSREVLEFHRDKYEKQGSNLFSCLYLNDPVPSEDMQMHPDHLRFFDPEDPEFGKKTLNTMILVDPSPAEKQSEGDPNAITAMSMDSDGAYYLREIRRGWWKLHEIVEQILAMYKIYRPYQISVESVACQRWLGQELERAKMEASAYFETVPVTRPPTQRKWERQKIILFPLRAGKIHIREPEREPCFRWLKAEMRGFPKARNDDILDTIADGIDLLTPPMEPVSEHIHGFRMPPVLFERKQQLPNRLHLSTPLRPEQIPKYPLRFFCLIHIKHPA